MIPIIIIPEEKETITLKTEDLKKYISDAYCSGYSTLLDAPAVTPVKTGQWVFIDKAHEHAYCSECGYGNVDLFNGRPHNYCPNCGAKMEEEENE